jgi:class 3 adenylate cyclase
VNGQAIQRGRPGEPSASALPVDGQVCTIFAVDIVGFTRPDRDDDIRRYLHNSLYELLEKAFDGSGISWAECYHEDRGDGALVVMPPGIPARGIIDPMPERLRRLIRRHNHVSCAEAGLQLRAAVHIGPVDHDGYGFVGTDINLAFRMLEARPLKRLVAASGAELGLAVSDYVYRALICRYPGSVSPDALQSVRFQTKKTKARAWVYLPGSRPVSTVPDVDSIAELPPRPPEADSKPEFHAPGMNGQQIPITEPATAEDTVTSSPSLLVCDLRR